jgi:hypothetical protein
MLNEEGKIEKHNCKKNSSPQLRGSKQPLLLLLMETVGDLLGDQGSVAAGAVVDNWVDLDLAFYGSFTIQAVSLIIF